MSIVRTVHSVQQGTGPWLRLREGFFTASEAPAALGVSRYVTRAELLRRKHTGVAAEPDAATLGRFAAGHAAEARARPLAEELAEGELFPVTMSAEIGGLRLLASLDGLTFDDSIVWETKLWNEELAEQVRTGALPEHYTVQMDQELLVSGAGRCLFTCTDGTPERLVSCWYEARPERFEALLSGWIQFEKDLAAYVLPDAPEPAPVGKAPETLPALRIEVTGMVTASNLAEFKATALAAIRNVNRSLSTDADFADAAEAVKWCEAVEAKLEAAKQHALSQTASIDDLFRTIDDIAAEARLVRLDLEKLTTRRKTEVKEEAIARARRALDAHIATLQAEIAPMRLPAIAADFAGAIKGLRSVDSMQNALDSTLTVAKIAADADARAIRGNLAVFQAQAGGHEFLFSDLAGIVSKAADDFERLVRSRIDAHKAAEVVRENQRQAAAEAEANRRLQAAAAEAERQTAAAVAAAQRQQDPAPAVASAAPARVFPREGPPTLAAPPPRPDEPATLSLGTICARLQFTVTAAFLADVLHIRPAATQGAAKLFREGQFQVICAQLCSHISAMAELHAGEPA